MSVNPFFGTGPGRLSRPPARLLFGEVWGLVKPRLPIAWVKVLRKAPKGDGHPVLVIPGFLTNDRRTARLRRFLKGLDYPTYGWRLGINPGPTDRVLAGLDALLCDIHARHGRKVSVIGHSLGGALARDLAKRHPDLVRQVITLCSPIQLPTASLLEPIFRFMSRRFSAEANRSVEELNAPPPVPVTAIYSKQDGLVAWQSCLEAPGEGRESIELTGDHSMMPNNPSAMRVIAERLAASSSE